VNVGIVNILMTGTTGLHADIINAIMQIFVRGRFHDLLGRCIANDQQQCEQHKGEIYNSILHPCKIVIFEDLNRVGAGNLDLFFGNYTIFNN